jgi:lipopolysaccharide/colanic/teichoic acid biosynthesis glycosyltransferase
MGREGRGYVEQDTHVFEHSNGRVLTPRFEPPVAQSRRVGWLASAPLLVTELATPASVALACRLSAHASWGEALLTGAFTALLALALHSMESAPQWRALGRIARDNSVKPGTLLTLVVVLAVVRETLGWGLEIVPALVAVAAGTLATVILRRLLADHLAPRPVRVLIVGAGEVGRHVAQTCAAQRGLQVIGFADEDPRPSRDLRYPVLGDLSDVPGLVRRYAADSVIFAYAARRDRQMVQVMRECRSLGVAVGVVPRMFQEFDRRFIVRRVSGLPVLAVEPRWRDRRLPRLTRAVDIGVSLVGLVVTAPLFVLIGIAIKVESRGPVFYWGRRVGEGGREFDMLKFRKMPRDAAGPRLTLAHDDRLTRLGRFLHLTKLDELPQLWNVLRGQMTLVGPRPEDPAYVALYAQEYRRILDLRPGITGLAQIQYRDEAKLLVGPDYEQRYRNELLPDKITIDRYYADRKCLGLDARIIGWTLVAIFRGARIERCEVTDHLTFHRYAERS